MPLEAREAGAPDDGGAPEVYFGRIDRTWPEAHRRVLWEKGRFAVMFDNEGKVEREALRAARAGARAGAADALGYHGNAAALPTLNRLLDAIDARALVLADFRGLHEGPRAPNVLLGTASGIDIVVEELEGRRYKCIQLANVAQARMDPVLAALRPQQSTFTAWRVAAARVRALYARAALPRTVESLTPGQLEALCYEHLRLAFPPLRLLLPVGRTLPDVDIYGWLPEGPVVAQVTHTRSTPDVVRRKAQGIASVVPGARARFLFAGRDALAGARADGRLPPHVAYVAVEDVFEAMDRQDRAFIDAMLRASG